MSFQKALYYSIPCRLCNLQLTRPGVLNREAKEYNLEEGKRYTCTPTIVAVHTGLYVQYQSAGNTTNTYRSPPRVCEVSVPATPVPWMMRLRDQ
jgi:hypothetical protein